MADILGWEVVASVKDLRGAIKTKVISRRFTIKQAAAEFCDLCRKEHPSAEIRTVYLVHDGATNA